MNSLERIRGALGGFVDPPCQSTDCNEIAHAEAEWGAHVSRCRSTGLTAEANPTRIASTGEINAMDGEGWIDMASSKLKAQPHLQTVENND